MIRIKICGLSRACDIEAANRCRPDYAGFVFAKSRRQVTPREAAELRRLLDPGILPVGVFVNAPVSQMERLVKDGVIDAIQLHEQEEEDVIRTLQRDLGCPVIKAFSVRSALDLQRAAGSCADYVLLDYGAGGTGHSFDWRLLEETPLNRPWFLAGGISPENALEAAQTGAWALDVSSGVETDGKKDPEKMSGIVRRIRNGERQIRHIRGTVHPGNIDE